MVSLENNVKKEGILEVFENLVEEVSPQICAANAGLNPLIMLGSLSLGCYMSGGTLPEGYAGAAIMLGFLNGFGTPYLMSRGYELIQDIKPFVSSN